MFWPPLMRISCNIYKYADIWCKNKNAIFIVCFQCKRLHLLLNSYSLLSHPMLTRCNSQHKHSLRDDDDDNVYFFISLLMWKECVTTSGRQVKIVAIRRFLWHTAVFLRERYIIISQGHSFSSSFLSLSRLIAQRCLPYVVFQHLQFKFNSEWVQKCQEEILQNTLIYARGVR